jgi:hypothetical protein
MNGEDRLVTTRNPQMEKKKKKEEDFLPKQIKLAISKHSRS